MVGGDGFGVALALFGAASSIFAGFFVARAHAKASAAGIWKGETEAVRARADRLQHENSELTATVRELTAKTDITPILQLIARQMDAAEERTHQAMGHVASHFERHEARATERHSTTMEAFTHLNEGLSAITRSLTSQAVMFEAATQRASDREDRAVARDER